MPRTVRATGQEERGVGQCRRADRGDAECRSTAVRTCASTRRSSGFITVRDSYRPAARWCGVAAPGMEHSIAASVSLARNDGEHVGDSFAGIRRRRSSDKRQWIIDAAQRNRRCQLARITAPAPTTPAVTAVAAHPQGRAARVPGNVNRRRRRPPAIP
jgi:hypothetical protein